MHLSLERIGSKVVFNYSIGQVNYPSIISHFFIMGNNPREQPPIHYVEKKKVDNITGRCFLQGIVPFNIVKNSTR